jgi:hypothetical protein
MNSQDFEPRLSRVEVDIVELKQSISDLQSTISTLADLVTIQQNEAQTDRAESHRRFEESRQQADQDRALMLQLIQAIAQGRNGSL